MTGTVKPRPRGSCPGFICSSALWGGLSSVSWLTMMDF
jgi:hypothetical protein